MRLFRPKFLIPRMILLGLTFLFLALASRPIIRSIVLQSVQSLLGGHATVAEVHTSLSEGRVRLVDFSAADFHNAGQTLFRAEAIELELDRDQLLRRKSVVRRGRVIGLEVFAGHDDVPAIAVQPCMAEHARQFQKMAGCWFGKAAEEMAIELEPEAHSIQVANELLERWPDEYGDIESKANDLKTRVLAVNEILKGAGTNPLRNLAAYEQAIGELESLGREIFEVRRQVDVVRQQIEMDRDTVRKIREEDLAQIHSQVAPPAIDEAMLSDYFLNADVARQLDTVVKWLQLSRRFTPTLMAQHSLRRHRGIAYTLPTTIASPDVLIETLVLQGTVAFGPQTVNIEGTIRNLSSDPKTLGKPTEFTIQTTGHLSLLVQGELDSSGDVSKDHFVIDCPGLPQERRLLGDPKQFALAVAPGQMHLWANISIVGDSLEGEVRMKQDSSSVTPHIHPGLSSLDVAQALDVTLSTLESIDVSVRVEGSLTSPTWTLRSNLGAHVAEGMRSAVESSILAHRESQLLEAHAGIDEKVRVIEKQLLAKQQAILESLQFGSDEIERSRKDIATRVESSDPAGISPLR